MIAKILKVLSALGLTSAGTGLGLGLNANGVDWWGIAISVTGLAMTWLVGSQFAGNYRKMKAVIHEIDDMLADDKVELNEIKDIMAAWKSGEFQAD